MSGLERDARTSTLLLVTLTLVLVAERWLRIRAWMLVMLLSGVVVLLSLRVEGGFVLGVLFGGLSAVMAVVVVVRRWHPLSAWVIIVTFILGNLTFLMVLLPR